MRWIRNMIRTIAGEGDGKKGCAELGVGIRVEATTRDRIQRGHILWAYNDNIPLTCTNEKAEALKNVQVAPSLSLHKKTCKKSWFHWPIINRLSAGCYLVQEDLTWKI